MTPVAHVELALAVAWGIMFAVFFAVFAYDQAYG